MEGQKRRKLSLKRTRGHNKPNTTQLSIKRDDKSKLGENVEIQGTGARNGHTEEVTNPGKSRCVSDGDSDNDKSSPLRKTLMKLQQNCDLLWQDFPLSKEAALNQNTRSKPGVESNSVSGENIASWVPLPKACMKCLTRQKPPWDPWENWHTTMEQGSEKWRDHDETNQNARAGQNRVRAKSGMGQLTSEYGKQRQDPGSSHVFEKECTSEKSMKTTPYTTPEVKSDKATITAAQKKQSTANSDASPEIIVIDEEEAADSSIHDNQRNNERQIKGGPSNKKPLFKQKKSSNTNSVNKGVASGKMGPMSKFMTFGKRSTSESTGSTVTSKTSQKDSVEVKSSSQTTLQSCPLCTMDFDSGLSQLDIDAHIAACLSSTNVDVLW